MTVSLSLIDELAYDMDNEEEDGDEIKRNYSESFVSAWVDINLTPLETKEMLSEQARTAN